MSTSDFSRRRFIELAAASGVFSIVPRHVLGGAEHVAPSEKITLAHIGMGTQGFNELGGLLAEPEIQIVAVCDPNTDGKDYVEWGKNSVRNTIRTLLGDPSWREGESGCPGGREVGRHVVNTYYAKQRGAENFQACTAYADFRELLDKEKDVDAVKVMTPDHLHATICVAAMKKGKHVLVHKPLANRMYEARLSIQTARQTKVATHLLAYGSGSGNARIAARVQEGVIGTLREVHNWSNRPVWPQYTEIPTDRPPIPQGFDWDLWLGPAIDRPYHPHYTHTVFRGWYDFGGGSMADMGIYSLWPVFTTLKLDSPISASVGHSHLLDRGPGQPTGAKRFRFSHRLHDPVPVCRAGRAPGLQLFWYDGGMKPRLPESWEAQGAEWPIEGILFVGDEGMIMAGFNGQNPLLLAKSNSKSEPLGPGKTVRGTPDRDPADPAVAATSGCQP